MITDQQLEAAGYKRHRANKVAYEFADYFYQRLVADVSGKRYWIQMVHYESVQTIPEAWLCDMVINQPHVTF